MASSVYTAQDPMDVQGNLTVTGNVTVKGALTVTGDIAAASVTVPATTYNLRPATPVEGMMFACTNASLATWGSTLAGGGTNHVLAYYNGTTWKIIGA